DEAREAIEPMRGDSVPARFGKESRAKRRSIRRQPRCQQHTAERVEEFVVANAHPIARPVISARAEPESRGYCLAGYFLVIPFRPFVTANEPSRSAAR